MFKIMRCTGLITPSIKTINLLSGEFGIGLIKKNTPSDEENFYEGNLVMKTGEVFDFSFLDGFNRSAESNIYNYTNITSSNYFAGKIITKKLNSYTYVTNTYNTVNWSGIRLSEITREQSLIASKKKQFEHRNHVSSQSASRRITTVLRYIQRGQNRNHLYNYFAQMQERAGIALTMQGILYRYIYNASHFNTDRDFYASVKNRENIYSGESISLYFAERLFLHAAKLRYIKGESREIENKNVFNFPYLGGINQYLSKYNVFGSIYPAIFKRNTNRVSLASYADDFSYFKALYRSLDVRFNAHSDISAQNNFGADLNWAVPINYPQMDLYLISHGNLSRQDGYRFTHHIGGGPEKNEYSSAYSNGLPILSKINIGKTTQITKVFFGGAFVYYARRWKNTISRYIHNSSRFKENNFSDWVSNTHSATSNSEKIYPMFNHDVIYLTRRLHTGQEMKITEARINNRLIRYMRSERTEITRCPIVISASYSAYKIALSHFQSLFGIHNRLFLYADRRRDLNRFMFVSDYRRGGLNKHLFEHLKLLPMMQGTTRGDTYETNLHSRNTSEFFYENSISKILNRNNILLSKHEGRFYDVYSIISKSALYKVNDKNRGLSIERYLYVLNERQGKRLRELFSSVDLVQSRNLFISKQAGSSANKYISEYLKPLTTHREITDENIHEINSQLQNTNRYFYKSSISRILNRNNMWSSKPGDWLYDVSSIISKRTIYQINNKNLFSLVEKYLCGLNEPQGNRLSGLLSSIALVQGRNLLISRLERSLINNYLSEYLGLSSTRQETTVPNMHKINSLLQSTNGYFYKNSISRILSRNNMRLSKYGNWLYSTDTTVPERTLYQTNDKKQFLTIEKYLYKLNERLGKRQHELFSMMHGRNLFISRQAGSSANKYISEYLEFLSTQREETASDIYEINSLPQNTNGYFYKNPISRILKRKNIWLTKRENWRYDANNIISNRTLYQTNHKNQFLSLGKYLYGLNELQEKKLLELFSSVGWVQNRQLSISKQAGASVNKYLSECEAWKYALNKQILNWCIYQQSAVKQVLSVEKYVYALNEQIGKQLSGLFSITAGNRGLNLFIPKSAEHRSNKYLFVYSRSLSAPLNASSGMEILEKATERLSLNQSSITQNSLNEISDQYKLKVRNIATPIKRFAKTGEMKFQNARKRRTHLPKGKIGEADAAVWNFSRQYGARFNRVSTSINETISTKALSYSHNNRGYRFLGGKYVRNIAYYQAKGESFFRYLINRFKDLPKSILTSSEAEFKYWDKAAHIKYLQMGLPYQSLNHELFIHKHREYFSEYAKYLQILNFYQFQRKLQNSVISTSLNRRIDKKYKNAFVNNMDGYSGSEYAPYIILRNNNDGNSVWNPQTTLNNVWHIMDGKRFLQNRNILRLQMTNYGRLSNLETKLAVSKRSQFQALTSLILHHVTSRINLFDRPAKLKAQPLLTKNLAHSLIAKHYNKHFERILRKLYSNSDYADVHTSFNTNEFDGITDYRHDDTLKTKKVLVHKLKTEKAGEETEMALAESAGQEREYIYKDNNIEEKNSRLGANAKARGIYEANELKRIETRIDEIVRITDINYLYDRIYEKIGRQLWGERRRIGL